jgi:hypothetical protein
MENVREPFVGFTDPPARNEPQARLADGPSLMQPGDPRTTRGLRRGRSADRGVHTLPGVYALRRRKTPDALDIEARGLPPRHPFMLTERVPPYEAVTATWQFSSTRRASPAGAALCAMPRRASRMPHQLSLT